MSEHVVIWLQTWPEIKDDFHLNWWIYTSMPIVAAMVGYVTKVVAVEMIYRPLEFKGIGPIGWQGIVPRRAGKVAAVTIDRLTENLLKPEEILDKIDGRDAVEQLREPLTAAIDATARELCEQLRPGLWDSLPELGRRAIQRRIHEAAPTVADRLLAEMRNDLGRYVDLQFLAVNILVRNKAKLNALMRSVGDDAVTFMRRSGIYFGLLIGLVQVVAWATIHNVWIMPAFGFATGFVSDWLALNMLFRPVLPTKLLGFIPAHGVLHAQRAKITREYAKILANDIFSADALMEALLNGPTSEHLFDQVGQEISKVIDEQTGIITPVLRMVVGTQRYLQLKDHILRVALLTMPDTFNEAKAYAVQTLDIENTIVEKMDQLSNEEFEAILRPVFKDDEPLMITVGAVLGFLVGELQVQLIEHLSR